MKSPVSQWMLRYSPRRWQTEALDSWRAANRMGIVQVVTGAGKTILAEMCMLDFLESRPTAKTVIVVPTLSLLDQWYVSLHEELNVPQQQIATYSGEGRPERANCINLMVLNTARQAAPQVAVGHHTLLIVDECHRAGTPKNALALSGSHAATLGMSATPQRDYDDGFDAHLKPALGDTIYEYGYNQAIKDGVVTSFDLVNVSIDFLPPERQQYEALNRRIGRAMHMAEGNPRDDPRVQRLLRQRAAIVTSAALRIPTAVHIARQHEHEKVLIFHERIDAARKIHELLTAKGVSAALYHSQLGPAIRRDNLRLFRQGAFDVLVSCRALDEGMNVPETSVAIVASATASSRQRIQRMGRVLRPAAGKTHANIFTIYSSEQEEQRLAREARMLEANSVAWQRLTIDV